MKSIYIAVMALTLTATSGFAGGCKHMYTVDDMERMRKDIEWLNMGCGGTFRQSELDIKVEQQLTTYIQNCTKPEEINKVAEKKIMGCSR